MSFLRRLRTSAALRRGANDGGVLAAIRSELSHELASSAPSIPAPFSSQDAPDFVTVSDAPQAQDVLLRRRDDSEEVLVSALLAPLQFVDQAPLPRDALMKVFISKSGVVPVLHFDCRTFWVGEAGGEADCAIDAVRYHPIPGEAGDVRYQGPEIRYFEPKRRFESWAASCIARISSGKRRQLETGKLNSPTLASEGALPIFELAEDYGRDVCQRSLIMSSTNHLARIFLA
nr:unnamed protein product [Digitaria exilis]